MAGRTTSSNKISTANKNFFLVFPGNELMVSDILASKKSQDRGNKDEAVTALVNLEKDGLGQLCDLQTSKHSSHQVSVNVILAAYLINCNTEPNTQTI